jgi:transcriptional regulator with XRE-family HTH domain
MDFTPAQCRAARALIGWSQDQLAVASKVAKATIANFELGKRAPYDRTLADIRAALERAGIEFTNGEAPGVRMPKDRTYGFVNDDQRLVGLVKNGEFRSDRDGSLVAVVKDGNLHDPQTGEWIAALDQMRATGNPLPDALKDKLK